MKHGQQGGGAALELKHVTKIFGPNPTRIRQALEMAGAGADKDQVLAQTGCTLGVNNVSLTIAPGQITVIMGLSGSGKSTLLRHLNRLIDPSAGEILFGGQDILRLNTQQLLHFRRHKVSMVFQSFALLPHKTVAENIAFGLMVRGENARASHARAQEWIDGRLGLRGFGGKYPDELSGGMRQRVGLARALVADTDIVLLDEAFSALDPLIRAQMQEVLLTIQQEVKKTFVFITHDLDEALKIGTHIAIMRDGCVVQAGNAHDILNHPANDYVRRFVERRSVSGPTALPPQPAYNHTA